MTGEGPGKLLVDQNSEPTKMLSSVQGNLGNQEGRILAAAPSVSEERLIRATRPLVWWHGVEVQLPTDLAAGSTESRDQPSVQGTVHAGT